MQPHFSKGACDSIAFVFPCPGEKEELAGHPAAGVTGRNLERLLPLLAHHLGQSALTRIEVTIANAWKDIEYRGLTGRSEATDAEIRLPRNMQRLAAQVQHVTELIVFCGDKAWIAAQELRVNHLLSERPKFAFSGHLGTLGLNRIICDIEGNLIRNAKEQRRAGSLTPLREIRSDNTLRQLNVVAASLAASIASMPAASKYQ